MLKVQLLQVRFTKEERLCWHTSFHIGGPADYFCTPCSTAELAEAIQFARENGLPVHIVGSGTNLLVRNSHVPGIIISTKKMKGIFLTSSTEVTAQCGAPLAQLISATCERGLSGLEALAGIPGTVGGAVFMNAGGKYGSIAPVVQSVSTLTMDGERRFYDRSDLRFEYRKGPVTDEVITEVSLSLNRSSETQVRCLVTGILRERAASQPLSAMSAGCIFKNPGEISAGKLIDECGLKGQTSGRAQISPVHANFIVNLGGATASEVQSLIGLARRSVAERFGIELELEVTVI
jgi:UDP-N-acetylmuramate dehydrogenase